LEQNYPNPFNEALVKSHRPDAFVRDYFKLTGSTSGRFLVFTNNTFNPSTTIRYQLAQAGEVKLQIFSITGQLVRDLVDERQNAGQYAVTWDGLDQAGRYVASGTYFYRLRVGNLAESKKMVLVR